MGAFGIIGLLIGLVLAPFIILHLIYKFVVGVAESLKERRDL